MSRLYPLMLATCVIAALLQHEASAQSPPASQAQPAGGDVAYRPGLGDLMTMTVQPRHIKLGLAGRARNWTYADYELHELGEAFERAARVWPRWRAVPVAQMLDFNTKEPMAALAQAIKAHEGAKFDAAYAQLTESCNTCHQGADRGMIVIRIPDAAMFPDQDFGPAPH